MDTIVPGDGSVCKRCRSSRRERVCVERAVSFCSDPIEEVEVGMSHPMHVVTHVHIKWLA